jgi:hypothetical protein
MCNSIRISDHPGKARLAYRYNVDITRVSFEKMPYRNLDRYFYPVSFIDKLILDIKARRIERKSKYGEAAYFKRMSDFKDKSLTAKGFWAGATLITKESYLDKPRIVRLLGSDGKVIAELGSRQPGTKFVVTDIVLQDRTEDNMVIYNVYSCGEIIDAVGGYEITEISRPSSKQDAV